MTATAAEHHSTRPAADEFAPYYGTYAARDRRYSRTRGSRTTSRARRRSRCASARSARPRRNVPASFATGSCPGISVTRPGRRASGTRSPELRAVGRRTCKYARETRFGTCQGSRNQLEQDDGHKPHPRASHLRRVQKSRSSILLPGRRIFRLAVDVPWDIVLQTAQS